MRVAVLNYTGNVGKTVIAANLLAPRMNNAPVYAIETINETAASMGVDVQKLRGDEFRALFQQISFLDDAIVDVGASNVEEFLSGLTKYAASTDEIEYFIVPVTAGEKEMKETIAMVNTLAQMGIEASRVLVVCNRVKRDAVSEFQPIFNFAEATNSCRVSSEAVIFEIELYDMLARYRMSASVALADTTDYKQVGKAAMACGDEAAFQIAADKRAIKAMAKTASKQLDAVFNHLFANVETA